MLREGPQHTLIPFLMLFVTKHSSQVLSVPGPVWSCWTPIDWLRLQAVFWLQTEQRDAGSGLWTLLKQGWPDSYGAAGCGQGSWQHLKMLLLTFYLKERKTSAFLIKVMVVWFAAAWEWGALLEISGGAIVLAGCKFFKDRTALPRFVLHPPPRSRSASHSALQDKCLSLSEVSLWSCPFLYFCFQCLLGGEGTLALWSRSFTALPQLPSELFVATAQFQGPVGHSSRKETSPGMTALSVSPMGMPGHH